MPTQVADTIELTYDPLLLPTAQHRAGLAGLLVLCKSLQKRKDDGQPIGPLPEPTIDDEGVVRLRLSKASLQTVFDDMFDADWEERRSRTEPKGGGFRKLRPEIIPASGDAKKPTTQFVYEVLVPKAAFYGDFGPPDDEKMLWRKLWRDAIWATLRGRPKSRLLYEQRRDGKPVDQAGKVWADLTNKKLGPDKPAAFSEALLIGAQSVTADGVPFEGTARDTLLLYFWPVVTLVGQAREIKTERAQGETRTREDDAGYVFTVPDVSDIDEFVDVFPNVLADLSGEPARDGYRPAEAILAIPQQGALEYVYHLDRLTQARAARSDLRYSVTGVETYQLVKRGNNIPIIGVGRVAASRRLASDYANVRSGLWSPIFRAQVIQNVLRDHLHGDGPWYRDFGDVFARHDWHLFVGDAATPFAHDARIRLTRETETLARGRDDRS